MSRINVFAYDEQTQAHILTGYFDPDTCEAFQEATRWDGSNHISVNTDSQREHETLYRTPGGRWVLEHRSQWQGVDTTYQFLDDTKAEQWLLIADQDDAVRRFFGAIPAERGPGGRPPIGGAIGGSTFPVKFPADLLAKVDADAATAGISRAEWLRRSAKTSLAAGQPYTVQVSGAGGAWDGDNVFFSLPAALQARDELNAEVPPHQQSWKQFRVVDADGHVMQCQQEGAGPR